MDKSTLKKYLEDGIKALSGVRRASHKQNVSSWNCSGWIYNPPTMCFNGGSTMDSLFSYMFSSENTDPDFYFISEPEIDSPGDNDAAFTVRFLFGHLKDEFQSSGLDIFLSVVMNFDETGRHLDTGGITIYQNESHGLKTFPLPHALPFLPEGLAAGVDSALVAYAYAKEVNEWMIQQGYTDVYAGKEGLAGFGSIVINQLVFSARCAFNGAPELTLTYAPQLSRPYMEAIRGWSEYHWEHKDLYFEMEYCGQTIRFWWPTFVSQTSSWSCMLKFDMVRSFGKDDHAMIFLTGDFDRESALYGQTSTFTGSIGKVLAISAVSNYQHSGGEDVSVSVGQPEDASEPLDVLQPWMDSWVDENGGEPPDTRNFSGGVLMLVREFVSQLRTASSVPMAGVWDVSEQGQGATALWPTAFAELIAGCKGEVFKLDPLSTEGAILARRDLPDSGANAVSLVSIEHTVYAGINGKVYALSSDDLTDAFNTGGEGSSYDLTEYTASGHVAFALSGRRLFAACSGWVFELDPGASRIRWSYDLNRLSGSVGQFDVDLLLDGEVLFAGSNGFVAKLPVFEGRSEPCTGPSQDSVLYNLPSCGNHVTTLAKSEDGGVFAACHGYVFRLDSDSQSVAWGRHLPSDIGDHKIQLRVIRRDTLLVGSNGYVMRLACSDGSAQKDAYGSVAYNVSKGGHDDVMLMNDGEGGLAACQGYVYRLNENHYNITYSPPTGSATLCYNMSLSDRSGTRLALMGNTIYAGMSGMVEALPLKPYNYG